MREADRGFGVRHESMNLRKAMAIKLAYYYDRNTTSTTDGKARCGSHLGMNGSA